MRTNESGRTQVIMGLALLALVAGAVALDTYSNVTYGIANGGHLFGGYFLIAAICLVVLPWGGAAGYARWFALFMTVWASVNTCAGLLGQDMQAKNDRSAKHLQAKADASTLRLQLGRITETAGVKALESLDQAAEKAANDAETRDTQRMGEKACFKPCQDARKASMAIKERLAQAQAREALQAKLAEEERKADANPNVEASVIAASIAAWTGMDAEGLARAFLFVMAGLAIAMITTVATLGQRGFALIASGRAAMRKAAAKPAATVKVAPAAPCTTATKQRGRKGKLTASEALKILQDLARRTDGRIVGSNATLAASLGVPVSTLCDPRKGWLSQWEKQGLVRIEVRKRGQTVVAVSAAKVA